MPNQRRVAVGLAVGHAALAVFFVVLRHFTPSGNKGF